MLTVRPSLHMTCAVPYISWLLKVYEVYFQMMIHRDCVFQRKSVFTWLAAVAVDLGEGKLPSYLPLILPPLVREFTNASAKEGKPGDSCPAKYKNNPNLGNELIF